MGGENYVGRGSLYGNPGSSPRGRGKRPKPKSHVSSSRLIPAWAGKTARSTFSASGVWAHPRVGGENLFTASARDDPWGSSPRGRGKLDTGVQVTGAARLIPAWAGKTSACDAHRVCLAAHPRVGGENAAGSGAGALGLGSSPRGRGKHEAGDGQGLDARLIPAWAGKTRTCPPAYRRWRAHPRVGGENQVTPIVVRQEAGSSPRGRGKPCP